MTDTGIDTVLKVLANTPKFIPAVLNDRKGSLSERWYIDFSAWDAANQRLKKKRVWVPAKLKTAKERRAWATKKVAEINKFLYEGYHFNKIDNPEPEPPKPKPVKPLTFAEGIKLGAEIKVSQGRKQSNQSNTSVSSLWLRYLDANKLSRLPLAEVATKHIHGFLDYCMRVRRVNATTRNNYLQHTKGFFSVLIERGHIGFNPTAGIKRLKAEAGKNTAFTDTEIARLKPLIQADTALWVFVQMMYYLYIRPNELRFLKVRHIDLQAGKVHIPASISKNKKSESVNIPGALLPELHGFINQAQSGEFYVFGRAGVPGLKQISKNIMGNRHRAILQGLGFSAAYTLYSWKHTGVIKAYRAGIDIKAIQAQCRHSSLEITDKYLRSLGLFENREIRDNFPEI